MSKLGEKVILGRALDNLSLYVSILYCIVLTILVFQPLKGFWNTSSTQDKIRYASAKPFLRRSLVYCHIWLWIYSFYMNSSLFSSLQLFGLVFIFPNNRALSINKLACEIFFVSEQLLRPIPLGQLTWFGLSYISWYYVENYLDHLQPASGFHRRIHGIRNSYEDSYLQRTCRPDSLLGHGKNVMDPGNTGYFRPKLRGNILLHQQQRWSGKGGVYLISKLLDRTAFLGSFHI